MLLKRANHRTLLEGLLQYNKSSFIFIVKTEYSKLSMYYFFLEKKEVKRSRKQDMSLKELFRNVPFPKSEIPKARS